MLLGFKRRFAQRVLDGSKTHTIRGMRKFPPKAGETCHCYVDPRQKSMALLGRWPCAKVEGILITASGAQIWIGPPEVPRGFTKEQYLRLALRNPRDFGFMRLAHDEREILAQRDGFASFAEMKEFWRGRLPFLGNIIHWRWSPEGGPLCELTPTRS